MANSGNKPLKKKEAISTQATLHCLCCNEAYDRNEFYDSDSELHESIGKIPYCKRCLENFYQHYMKKYKICEYNNIERKAVERICMMLDVYYSDKIFDAAVNESKMKVDTPFICLYFKHVKLYQYRKKNYDSTIYERHQEMKNNDSVMSIYNDIEADKSEDIKAATKLFGSGFSDDDYLYLYEQYVDWTTRHECETKSQEEVFKQICFTQLDLLKATRAKQDTKDLNTTFLKQLEAAKLQPKQNSGESVANNQTFGTLIDKWENTRPIPEPDDDFKDVDKIGLYITVFFKDHLAKMMGLKNGLSNLYTKFMKKYTVDKPEYNGDEDSEVLFDSIFGNASMDDDVNE